MDIDIPLEFISGNTNLNTRALHPLLYLEHNNNQVSSCRNSSLDMIVRLSSGAVLPNSEAALSNYLYFVGFYLLFCIWFHSCADGVLIVN